MRVDGYTLNGEPFVVYTFDNSASIKDRYATILGVKPSGCVIEPFDTIFEVASKSITVTVIDKLVKDMSITELKKNVLRLSEMTKTTRSKRSVPLLSMRDIMMMWIQLSSLTKKKAMASILSNFSQSKALVATTTPEYININEVENDFQAYTETNRAFQSLLECKRRFYTGFTKFVKRLPPQGVSVSDSKIEYTELRTLLTFGKGARLLEVFDAMDTSLIMPYVCVKYVGKTYYKMHHSAVKSMWTQSKDLVEDGIYFRTNFNMLVLEGEPKGEKGIKHEDYLHGFIDTSFNTTVRFPQVVGYDSSVRKIDMFLERTFGERLTYRYTQPEQTEVGGCAIFDDIIFNRTVFTHILNTTPLRYILFVKEMGEGNTQNVRTSSVKSRYLLYLKACHQYDNRNGVFLTLKTVPEYPDMLGMKFSKTRNIEHASAITNLLSVVFMYYLSVYDEIKSKYEAVLGTKAMAIKVKKVPQKQNKKTGDSLQVLQRERPHIFGGKTNKMTCSKKKKALNKYAITCPPDRQVRLLETREKMEEYIRVNKIRPSEASKYVMAYPKDGIPLGFDVDLEDDTHDDKVDWYACKNKKMFPDLQDNIEGGFPKKYVCCFTNPPKGGQSTSSKSTHILAPTKRVPDKRHGRVPVNIETILEGLGYSSVSHSRTRSNKDFVPFLVVGVQGSPSSFFTCAKNVFAGEHGKNKPSTTLHAFLTDPNQTFEFARQSLFDMTPQQTRKFIREGIHDYKDPSRWISCVEEWGKCNVFLIKVDSETPGGDLVIPYHNTFYVRRLELFPISVVIVMKSVNNLSKTYPYQCENLVKEKDVSRGTMEYIFDTNDPFIQQLITYFDRKIALCNSKR